MTAIKNFLKKYNLPLRYLLVITTLAASYVSTISFIQLGIPNFGTITLGLDEKFVNTTIFLFALVCGGTAYLGGRYLLHRFRNDINAIILLHGLLIVIGLSVRSLAPMVNSATGYLTWVLFMGVVSGLETVIIYALVFLLLPPAQRGITGGIITALAFGIAATSLPDTWTLDAFLHDSLLPTLITYASYIMVLIFILGRPVSQAVVDQNVGEKPYRDYNFRNTFIVLTLVLFVDSFGFIRIVMGTDDFAAITWHGGFSMLAYIGIVHVISALVFGRIYDRKNPLFMMQISLILFFAADLLFALFYGIPHLQMLLAYAFVLFYASAVSIYTIVYITLIADLVTKETMGNRYGVYIAVVGWIASFISTGISLALFNLISTRVHIILAAILSLVTLALLKILFKDTSLPPSGKEPLGEKDSDI